MILDEKGYKIGKSHLAKFEKALADLSQNQDKYENIDPRFLEVHRKTLITQIEKITQEIKDYELKKM